MCESVSEYRSSKLEMLAHLKNLVWSGLVWSGQGLLKNMSHLGVRDIKSTHSFRPPIGPPPPIEV